MAHESYSDEEGPELSRKRRYLCHAETLQKVAAIVLEVAHLQRRSNTMGAMATDRLLFLAAGTVRANLIRDHGLCA